MTTFSADDFVKALNSEQGILPPARSLTLIGMVKPSGAANDVLFFSPGTSCSPWIPVPVKLIEKVDHLGQSDCGNHQHELVRIHFKPIGNTEASVFARLLQAQTEAKLAEAGREAQPDAPGIEEVGAVPQADLERWGWRPPWTWSRCAKCELEVNVFITGSVAAAAAAAGTTGPGAFAVWEALIVGKYGLAAWEAVKAYIFSEGAGGLSKRICKALGKC